MSEYKDGRGDYYLAEGKREAAAPPADSAEALLRTMKQIADEGWERSKKPGDDAAVLAEMLETAIVAAPQTRQPATGRAFVTTAAVDYYLDHWGVEKVKRQGVMADLAEEAKVEAGAAAEGSEPLDAADERPAALKAIGGFLWLGNNLHNIEDDPKRFRSFYEAALEDARPVYERLRAAYASQTSEADEDQTRYNAGELIDYEAGP